MLSSKIEKTIEIAASPEDVFAALTEPEKIVSLFPFDRVESDKCVGGAYTCFGKLGGEPFTDYGVITAFDADRAFGYRYWSTNHGTSREPKNEIAIRYQLNPIETGTKLHVVQENLPTPEYAESMDRIWDSMLEHVKRSIEA